MVVINRWALEQPNTIIQMYLYTNLGKKEKEQIIGHAICN